jgi:3-methyladenine DNA glycosylase/8-oxoguanine DNA glycosylase
MIEFRVQPTPGYNLAETCAPVAWGGGRWPSQDWIAGELTSVSREGDRLIIRRVRQTDRETLAIFSDREAGHGGWADRVLGVSRTPPDIADPIVAAIAARFPGMRPLSNGLLFEGIVTAIVGQSISVQAAAVTERKLCALFSDGVTIGDRRYWPHPTAGQLANADPALVRLSGVTQRRAGAIVAIARLAVENQLPDPRVLAEDALVAGLLALPLVGRWTAESVLLWGLGADDAYPTGDVALLRAARLAYGQPDMTHSELNALAEAWRPGRSWAARWLWLNLFGPAPEFGPAPKRDLY